MFKCSKKFFGTAGEVNPAIGAEYRTASFQFGDVVEKRPLAAVAFKSDLSGRCDSDSSHYFPVSVGRQRQETGFEFLYRGGHSGIIQTVRQSPESTVFWK
jgi:hypothetical protein